MLFIIDRWQCYYKAEMTMRWPNCFDDNRLQFTDADHTKCAEKQNGSVLNLMGTFVAQR